MDSEKRNQSEDQPKQNELDLEFSQVEPITPKKIIEPKASLLDKAKELIGSLNKKGEANMSNHSERKEPIFGNTSESATPHSESEQHNTHTVTEPNQVEDSQPVQTQINQETASQPAQTTQTKADWKHPENWALLQKLPQKHRRLVVALVGAILLLLFFLWLKPESNTVDSLQAQNSNNLPIEFQPLDQSAVQNTPEPVAENESVIPTEPSADDNIINSTPIASENSNSTQVADTIANNIFLPAPAKTETAPVSEQPVRTAKPSEPKPAARPTQTTQTKPAVSQRTERQEKPATKPSTTQTTKTERKAAPVVDAKPARTETRNNTASRSQTLTVPQGVSLMQVFRNHNLNISDVNAMTKANGAGNTLSSFKPGDKVQVSLNSNGRVTELRLQDGSRFIRQSDGSYIYRK